MIYMKKNLGRQTYFFPLPVLIIATYDEFGQANAMNAAWGGIHDTEEIFLCLSSDHKTTQNIMKKKAFTVSFADRKHVVESDYFGIESGNVVVDKISKANMNVHRSSHIDAPIIDEYPVALECQVKSVIDNQEGSTYIVASIINVLADDEIVTGNGKLNMSKAGFITYDPVHHGYYVIGERVGNAFNDGLKIR